MKIEWINRRHERNNVIRLIVRRWSVEIIVPAIHLSCDYSRIRVCTVGLLTNHRISGNARKIVNESFTLIAIPHSKQRVE